MTEATPARSPDWLHEALGLSDEESPFPWQEELLARFTRGSLERSLDIPTGLGKTAVMAIWLVARAMGAPLPRRLVYVVDRRAVVDQATTVALELKALVDSHPDMKKALLLGEASLPISTLRGKHIDNKEWLADPASPAIVVGTVDMIGSRLLFEGYRVSRKMRPYHAGLLGVDSLLVLDEAHLVPPFEKLLEAIEDDQAEFGPRTEMARAIIPHLRVLSLSATGRASSRQPFGLTAADFSHPIVCRRLAASKRIVLVPMTDNQQLPEVLAQQAWELASCESRAVRIIVFCDKRKDAEATMSAIETRAKGDPKAGVQPVAVATELFVGGRRVFERDQAAERLKSLGFLAGSKVELTSPAFVVATSAGEVGVDLDADHMACDLVTWERMIQRLGRVNRRGEGNASVTVVVDPEAKPDKAVAEAMKKSPEDRSEKEAKAVARYESEREVARALLKPIEELPSIEGVPVGKDGSLDAIRKLRLRAIEDADLRTVLDAATSPSPLRPALTRAVIDAWSMTSLKEHTGRPEIVPWLRGWIADDPPQTSIIWRTHLPTRQHARVKKREIEVFFEAAPPHASEVLESETWRVADWLVKRAKILRKRADEQAADDTRSQLSQRDIVGIVLTSAGDRRSELSLESLDVSGDGKKKLEHSLSGATLVLDARVAGLKVGLLDSSENAVPVTGDDGRSWLRLANNDPVVRFRVRFISSNEQPSPADDQRWVERYRFVKSLSEEDEASTWLVVEKWQEDSATEDDRAVGMPQLLDEHQGRAERRACCLADRLSLPAEYKAVLSIAARLHDEGKRSKRWQNAFSAPTDGVYAKTAGPVRVSLLDGYRHEFGSLPIAARDPEILRLPPDLQDLALGLIAAHHGFGRPVIGISGCEDAPPSVLVERAKDVALRFARLQRAWGPWGLAWWESLLRAADHQASGEHEGDASNCRGK